MADNLDKTREFGTITGDDQGRCFEQDSCFYSADGSAWTEPKARAARPNRSAAAASTTPDDAQLAAQLDA